MNFSKLKDLTALKEKGYWTDRIVSQVEFAYGIEYYHQVGIKDILDKAIDFLLDKQKEEGMISKDVALECEKSLESIRGELKKYTLMCIAHAHIDMNWQWRYDETVMVVLDTFKTMLNLLKEYPEFRFSQSQASVYQMVEKYDPKMLEEIKKYVKEGRWEVTATTWVEGDKNLAGSESHVRQLLYAKKYLSELFDLDYDFFDMDYEPDTFGHSGFVPEILSQTGVKYYYHTRGFTQHMAYKWMAPSGKSILVYNDASYYNSRVTTEPALKIPAFTHKVKTDSMLYVYGVGDHGGGPSRRDIERLLDMQTWPLWPNIKFSSYREFFATLEKISSTLPTVDHELNFIFTGCYTSQSKIKKGNKFSESLLYEAEALSSLASIDNYMVYPYHIFEDAWQRVLFNQFHDILPGTGSSETIEHALGEYHTAFAAGNVYRNMAMNKIAANLDLKDYVLAKDEEALTTSEGAGTGSGVMDFKVSQICRGRGPTRIFTVFNPSFFDRKEVCEIELWNWEYDLKSIKVYDHTMKEISHQLVTKEPYQGWDVQFHYKILFDVDVPAMGYSTYILKSVRDQVIEYENYVFERMSIPHNFVLENKSIKASFSPVDFSLESFIDKKTNKDFISKEAGPGTFRLIEEATIRRRTSWIVSKYINIENLSKNAKLVDYEAGPNLIRQSLTYTCDFRNSQIKVTIYLDKHSNSLVYDLVCDWKEFGIRGDRVPQLNFILPFNYSTKTYKYQVPLGVLEREEANDDRPSTGFVLANNDNLDEKSLILYSDSKYGYRTYKNSIALTLIRGTYEPDPHPEIHMHKVKFALSLTADQNDNKKLIDEASTISHPLSTISVRPEKGHLPLTQSLVAINQDTSCVISALKLAEDNDKALILRLYESNGSRSRFEAKFTKDIKSIKMVKPDEKDAFSSYTSPITIKEKTFSLEVEAYNTVSLLIELED